jgi:electron transfer flavoprotein alpha subunit
MGIDNIWVFAQVADGAPTSGTLELLTRARSLGGTVSAFMAGDASGVAGALGDHGAATVYATGDLAGHLPGVAVASAMQAVIDGGVTPDLIMFPQSYEGRDVMARLSVKLDRTVLTNSTSVNVDGDSVTVQTPVFGGTKLVNSSTSRRRPGRSSTRRRWWWPVGAASANPTSSR